MDKEKLRKIIPYILIVVAVSMTLYSYVTMQNAENKCNDHWVTQIEEYELQLEKRCPVLETEFLPYDLGDVELNN